MKYNKSLIAAALVGAVLLAIGERVLAGEPTPAQARAQNQIEENAAAITQIAYVTAQKHTKVEYVKGVAYRDGSFDLTYKFYYLDSDGDPQTYTLRFEYDAKGELKKPVAVQHSSFWKPFNAIELFGTLLEEVDKAIKK